MKIVLDSNVFVSGIFFNGPPYQILKAWRDHRIELVVSPDILMEYERVGEIMVEEHPAINLKQFIEYVIQNAAVYDALPLPSAVCADPDDDKFLACALASGTPVIVSGDKH